MEIQAGLGSDIAMVLDECVPWPCERDYAAKSMEMTTRWAKRCKEWREESAMRNPQSAIKQMLFGIVQGAMFADLRRESAEAIVRLDFDGYAIGGVSVGEPEEEMVRAIEWSEPFLPREKPRYAMGLGTPPQMLEMIARGIDLFDCVLPTRLARNGTAFTSRGTLNLKNAEFILQKGPIEENCACYACSDFSRSYIRHLIKAEEILGLRLISLHNLHFYLDLMRQARERIKNQAFDEFRRNFVSLYQLVTSRED